MGIPLRLRSLANSVTACIVLLSTMLVTPDAARAQMLIGPTAPIIYNFSGLEPANNGEKTKFTPAHIISMRSVGALTLYQGRPPHNTVAPDPWQKLNRFTFKVNNTTDRYFLVPLARGYRKITTKKMRKAFRNFLNNLNTPVVLANDLLQGEFKRAGNTSARFIINSAIGLGGLADPAAQIGLIDHDEDFGQTLAVWGVPSGPYLVLPFLGPTTVRDSLGQAMDGFFLSPLNYIRTPAAQKARLSRTGFTILALREPLIEPLEDIERNSLDFYASFRSFYLQARRRDILNGETIPETLPDIGDGFDEFDDFDDFDNEDNSNDGPASQTSQEGGKL